MRDITPEGVVAEPGDVYTHRDGTVYEVILDLERTLFPDKIHTCQRGEPPVCALFEEVLRRGICCSDVADEIHDQHVFCDNGSRSPFILFKRRQS